LAADPSLGAILFLFYKLCGCLAVAGCVLVAALYGIRKCHPAPVKAIREVPQQPVPLKSGVKDRFSIDRASLKPE
jgi:hypothetical protein